MSSRCRPRLRSSTSSKAAFIRASDYLQAGNRLIGFLCSYTPLEIIDAAGASSVALCGTSMR
ncbi:MAG: hypothetical protein ACLRM9_00925 [Collinsella aerofaciens]